jgi:hypothetical protein
MDLQEAILIFLTADTSTRSGTGAFGRFEVLGLTPCFRLFHVTLNALVMRVKCAPNTPKHKWTGDTTKEGLAGCADLIDLIACSLLPL